jgi:hypothetical protein
MAGKCQPWTLATPGWGVGALNADSNYIVGLTGLSGPFAVKVMGSSYIGVTPTCQYAPGIPLANGTFAYVHANPNQSIYGGGEGQNPAALQAMLPATYYAWAMALNSSGMTAFMIAQTTASPYQDYLLQCPLSMGTCAPLGGVIASPGTQSNPQISGLQVNDTYAFWTYAGTPSSLARYTFGSNALDHMATLPQTFGPTRFPRFQGLTTDSANVYWTGNPTDTLYSAPQAFTTSTTPKMVASTTGLAVSGLATDGTNLYYGTDNPNAPASLYYVPVGGGAPVLLYTSPKGGAGADSTQGPVAVAGGAVYWVDNYNDCVNPTGTLMGLATP